MRRLLVGTVLAGLALTGAAGSAFAAEDPDQQIPQATSDGPQGMVDQQQSSDDDSQGSPWQGWPGMWDQEPSMQQPSMQMPGQDESPVHTLPADAFGGIGQ
ncbi:hypothetical protein [Saccharopolyspora rosea]|uniref:hypothetical protein n=1 Tax=Saccharopolyspora rosea TaxID=524884 RepID=UPI0021DAED42|nr:hypothetical protein [Saccharopolyspora rosea]